MSAGLAPDGEESAAPVGSILPMGERALLVETGSLDDTLALQAALAGSRPDGVVELVPAERTVLVVVDPRRLTLAAARSWIRHAPAVAADARTGREVELPVVYDGADLDETAELLGIRPDDLVRRHVRAAWTVAFTGFAPGFGYLVSPEWAVEVPRLASPRTRVPPGAVGLAGRYTGAYPRATPGGWRLVGRTDAALFDPSRADPALLRPGDRVRFRGVRATAAAGDRRAGAGSAGDGGTPLAAGVPPRAGSAGDAGTPAGARMSAGTGSAGGEDRAASRVGEARRSAGASGFRVLTSGPRSTVQDLGRPGAARLGVAPSGALDRGALRTANRLVGNPEGAAGLEVTLGGFEAVAERDLWIAVTGAWGAIEVDAATVDPGVAHAWPAGSHLRIGAPEHGVRSYLAVRGGVEASELLGSRATDTMAELGPAPLAAGDRVAVGHLEASPVPPSDLAPWTPPADELVLDVAPGPRADRVGAGLFDAVWTVTDRADRVGARLDGPPLAGIAAGELASEGMVPGAIQVPPDGRPVILLADGPATGGYPVVGVVTEAGLDLVAQARPGTRIRFRHARPHL